MTIYRVRRKNIEFITLITEEFVTILSFVVVSNNESAGYEWEQFLQLLKKINLTIEKKERKLVRTVDISYCSVKTYDDCEG